MAPERTKSIANVANKKPRKSLDLELKLKVIKEYEGGKRVMVISRQLGMSHSTVATILKNKDKVTEAVKGSASLRVTRLTKMREGPISDMEKLLMTWIEDQTQKRIPLSSMTITAKAKSLFAMLKEKAGPGYNVSFSASSGWLKRFKDRYSLHSVKMAEENVDDDLLLNDLQVSSSQIEIVIKEEFTDTTNIVHLNSSSNYVTEERKMEAPSTIFVRDDLLLNDRQVTSSQNEPVVKEEVTEPSNTGQNIFSNCQESPKRYGPSTNLHGGKLRYSTTSDCPSVIRVLQSKQNGSNDIQNLVYARLQSTEEDEFDVFGKSISMKLRKVSKVSPDMAILAEKLINEIIFEAQMGSLSRDSQKNTSTAIFKVST